MEVSGYYITFSDWGNRPHEDRMHARECPPKKLLRLSANKNVDRLLEVAQQICYHNDHSPLSEAECRSILQKKQVRSFVSLALSHCPTEIIES